MKEEAGELRRRREGWKTRKMMKEMVMSWDEDDDDDDDEGEEEYITLC